MCRNLNADFACKLTSDELRLRKDTAIAELKHKVYESEETENGFKYRFDGHDAMLDELIEFIKTERQCCPFFVFNLSATDQNEFVWLEITAGRNVKTFIKNELGF